MPGGGPRLGETVRKTPQLQQQQNARIETMMCNGVQRKVSIPLWYDLQVFLTVLLVAVGQSFCVLLDFSSSSKSYDEPLPPVY